MVGRESMNVAATVKGNRGWGILSIVLLLGLGGCAAHHPSMSTINKGMEYSARERYAQALRYMEANRFELAQEQFAIVKNTADSPELYNLACDGYEKTTAAIEARR
jgi:hypothetical protein